MEQILYSVPLAELLAHVRTIVREEINAVNASRPDGEKLLSVKEVSQLFSPQVTPQTIHNWARDGKITKHRIGGRVVFKQSEVMASLATLKKYKK